MGAGGMARRLPASPTAAVGSACPLGLCMGKGNSRSARAAEPAWRRGLGESQGGPQRKKKVGSGFDVRREDALGGVFEATAASLSYSPLLAGLGTCMDEDSSNGQKLLPCPHPLAGPLGTVSQGRPAQLLTMGKGRGRKV